MKLCLLAALAALIFASTATFAVETDGTVLPAPTATTTVPAKASPPATLPETPPKAKLVAANSEAKKDPEVAPQAELRYYNGGQYWVDPETGKVLKTEMLNLQRQVKRLDTKVGKVEQGQARLEQGQKNLAQGQKALSGRVGKLESDIDGYTDKDGNPVAGLNERMQTAENDIDTAQTAADTAKTAANTAQSTADAAKKAVTRYQLWHTIGLVFVGFLALLALFAAILMLRRASRQGNSGFDPSGFLPPSTA